LAELFVGIISVAFWLLLAVIGKTGEFVYKLVFVREEEGEEEE